MLNMPISFYIEGIQAGYVFALRDCWPRIIDPDGLATALVREQHLLGPLSLS